MHFRLLPTGSNFRFVNRIGGERRRKVSKRRYVWMDTIVPVPTHWKVSGESLVEPLDENWNLIEEPKDGNSTESH